MGKRVVFISIVILVVSSAASAGIWDWLRIIGQQTQTSSGQNQGLYADMEQAGTQIGAGTSAGTNSGNGTITQTNPTGTATQNSSFTGMQSTHISTGSGSQGNTYQSISSDTWHGQWF